MPGLRDSKAVGEVSNRRLCVRPPYVPLARWAIKADSTSVHGLDTASVLFGRGFFTAARASSRVSNFAADLRPGSSLK